MYDVGITEPVGLQAEDPSSASIFVAFLKTIRGQKASFVSYSVPLVPAKGPKIWESLVHVDLSPEFWPEIIDTDGDTYEERYKARKRESRGDALFANTRRKGIETLLLDRHGGQCDTDDAEAWLDAAIPYVIEANEIMGRSSIIASLKWSRKFCPLVPLDVVDGKVRTILDRRNHANAERAITGRNVLWLPRMDTLKKDLRIKFEEVTRLRLPGFGSIDRPSGDEMKIRKTDQRRRQRHDHGTRPRSTLVKTKCMESLANELSVSLSKIKRMRKSEGAGGPTDLRIAECAQRDPKMSPPYVQDIGSDKFGSSVETVSVPADAHVVQPQAEAEQQEVTVNDALMREGFTGRNISLDPAEVERLRRKFPHLREDMLDHLAMADVRMDSTPQIYGNRVRDNLLRYWNKEAGREVKKAA